MPDGKLSPPRTWSVVAPFFGGNPDERWIDDFVPEGRWRFRKVPLTAARDDWHSRARRATGLRKWIDYWDQARRAFPASGIITVFPQPAVMVAARKALRRTDVPLLAWCFNLGQHPAGLKRSLSRAALRSVDRFVVHSTSEVSSVSEFLDIPANRVEFVPLQRAPIPIEAAENLENPFVVTMGSANRDYSTFLKAAEITRLPCKLIASPRVLEGLRIPSNVTVESGLTASECHRIVQQSRFSVVPLRDPDIASGQVTVVESMRMNRSVITTASIGTTDYVRDGQSGILVPAGEPEALAAAMLKLWDDAALRQRYADQAASFAENFLSDSVAAGALERIMSQLEQER